MEHVSISRQSMLGSCYQIALLTIPVVSTTTFDAYATVNNIIYKTQDKPRPSRHTAPSMTTNPAVQPPPLNSIVATSSSLTISTIPSHHAPSFTSSVPNTTHQISNLRRINRMERQAARVATLPARRGVPVPLTSQPLKRNLSQQLLKARSSTAQGASESHSSLAEAARDPKPKAAAQMPFSQMLISHLPHVEPSPLPLPPPLIRTALTASQALRGTLHPAAHVGNGLPKDYSSNVWTCHCCKTDFKDMQSCTEHLRDHHGMESDVATLMPDRDVITIVMGKNL